MTSYVPIALRRLVAERSGTSCEYCLIPESATYLGCEVDHVIAEKHGGETVSENLAYACAFCNRNNGTDIATISPASGQMSRLFHPRRDAWNDHFLLSGSSIEPLTDVGWATSHLLGFNLGRRIAERAKLQRAGLYPRS